MSTIAGVFRDLTLARQAVLDLLTAGVPREDIGAAIAIAIAGAGQARAVAAQPPSDFQEDGAALPANRSRDLVEALVGARELTLPGVGGVVAAGPLAEALGAAGGLAAAGMPEDVARAYADELARGAAMILVRADDAWDVIVRGVFHHSEEPSLRAYEETAGPVDERALATPDVGPPVSSSLGALSGGMLPGGWGAAGETIEGLPDDARERWRRGEPQND